MGIHIHGVAMRGDEVINAGERAAAEPLLIDIKRASEMLGLSPRRIWGLEKCNAIPSRRVGRRLLFSPAELRNWIWAGCPVAPNSADAIRKEAGCA